MKICDELVRIRSLSKRGRRVYRNAKKEEGMRTTMQESFTRSRKEPVLTAVPSPTSYFRHRFNIIPPMTSWTIE